jgi:hypothetical protein
MLTSSRCVALLAVLSCGCGPGRLGDGGEASGGSETTSTGDGDPGDGDPGDGDGDGESGDGDGDGGPGDGDGDTGSACSQGELACPDGSCQPQSGDPYPCCGYGGACADGCEPQLASSTEDQCAEPLYAWDGMFCEAICACEGPDCDALYASPAACFEAHEPDCGVIGLSTCPFETPLGPTLLGGTTSYGPRSYEYGAFGPIYGEGSPVFNIVLATDALALGNHLWNSWSPPQSTEVLTIWGGGTTPGEYQAWAEVPIPFSEGPLGTLTIAAVDFEGLEYPDYGLWGSFDVSEGEWELHGDFAIPGCQKLEMHLP